MFTWMDYTALGVLATLLTTIYLQDRYRRRWKALAGNTARERNQIEAELRWAEDERNTAIEDLAFNKRTFEQICGRKVVAYLAEEQFQSLARVVTQTLAALNGKPN